MASSKIKGITIEIGGDTTKLGKAIEAVDKNTKSLQGELKQVEKLLKMDPGNTELLAQKQQILTKAVQETTDKLDTLRKAEAQVQDQFKRGDIGEDQLRAFQREVVKTENELDSFGSELKDTEEALKKAGKGAEDGGDGFTIMKGALADLTANAIQGALNAIGDLVGSLFELSEATEEYRTMQAKLAGSAETFGYSVEFANSKYEEFYKYLGDDQASTNAITNLMGIGTSTESLSELVDGCASAWASYGDSINLESLTEATNETITCGKVTGSFADTINWCKDANTQLGVALEGNKSAQKAYNDALKEGLPVEDAFNEALGKITDEQERADVVAKFLNNTYGESKKKYDELNSSVTEANKAELALKDTQAELGETIAPVNTEITNLKNKALEAIIPVVEELAEKFLDLITYLKENPGVVKVFTALIIALAGAFTVLATALGIQALIQGVTKAFALLNATLLANPIVLITALITGLVASFIYLWNNCEAFRTFWINLWANIKSFATTASNTVVTKIKEITTKVKTIGTDIVKGLWNGIKNSVNWIKEKVGGFAKGILDSMKSALGIHSPSKKAEKEIGEQIANGVIKGVTNKKENAKKSAKELAELYISAGKTKVSEMKKVNELSLADEIVFWETMLKHCSKGSEAYQDATQQLKLAKQDLNNELAKLDKNYSDAVEKVREDITKEIQAITDAYNKAVDDRQKQILSSMKLFEEFTPEEKINKYQLTANLQSQVDALREWDETLDALSNREGMSDSLLNELEEMGVGSLETLKQINLMTDEQLTAYIALYDEKKAIALERSKAEHEALKAESDAQITALILFAEDKMDELRKTYLNELKSLGIDATKASKTIGVNVVQGIIAGIDSQISALQAKMTELSAITIQTAQTELDINSPSRRFAEAVGKWIPEGIAQGILNNAGVASDAVRGVTDGLINGATINRQLATTFNTGSAVGAVDNGSLLDKLNGIYDRLGRLQIVLDTGTLVGETIDKIDNGLANRQLLYARGV